MVTTFFSSSLIAEIYLKISAKVIIPFVVYVLQYLAHVLKRGFNVFERFAVIITVVIVWIYAFILTIGGAYNDKAPVTQTSCRTDRAGIIDGAPW